MLTMYAMHTYTYIILYSWRYTKYSAYKHVFIGRIFSV